MKERPYEPPGISDTDILKVFREIEKCFAWAAGIQLPDCPEHVKRLAEDGCTVCDCLWLLHEGRAEYPLDIAVTLWVALKEAVQ